MATKVAISCSLLDQYDEYLTARRVRYVEQASASDELSRRAGEKHDSNRRAMMMMGLVGSSPIQGTVVAVNSAGSSSSERNAEEFAVLGFVPWLHSDAVCAERRVEFLASPEVVEVFPEDTAAGVGKVIDLDNGDEAVLVRIDRARANLAVLRKHWADLAEDRLRAEELMEERRRAEIREQERQERARCDAESKRTRVVPRALEKPGMQMARVKPTRDLWDLDTIGDMEDCESAFYPRACRAEAERYYNIKSVGQLLGIAYSQFIYALKSPKDALSIADGAGATDGLRPILSDVDEHGHSKALCPFASDGYRQYRRAAYFLGAYLRDQRVELALLEHFSFMAALAWLTWNPVDKDLLREVVCQAREHCNAFLYAAFRRHFSDAAFRPDGGEAVDARRALEALFNDASTGIIARSMEQPGGWLHGTAQIFNTSEDFGVAIDQCYVDSFQRSTLCPISRILAQLAEKTTNASVASIAASSSSAEQCGDASEEMDGAGVREPLTSAAIEVDKMESLPIGGEDGVSAAAWLRERHDTIDPSLLVHKVSILYARDDGQGYKTRARSYVVDRSFEAERERLEVMRDALSTDIRDGSLSAYMKTRTGGTMCPSMNLTRSSALYLSTIVATRNDAIAHTEALVAEKLFIGLVAQCSRSGVDWVIPRAHPAEIVASKPDNAKLLSRFLSVEEVLWRSALASCGNCIMSAAECIVEAIYPESADRVSKESRALIVSVCSCDVYNRERNSNADVTTALLAVQTHEANADQREAVLSAVLGDLLDRCAANSKARYLAALRTMQAAHAHATLLREHNRQLLHCDASELFSCDQSLLRTHADENMAVSKAVESYTKFFHPGNVNESRLSALLNVERSAPTYSVRKAFEELCDRGVIAEVLSFCLVDSSEETMPTRRAELCKRYAPILIPIANAAYHEAQNAGDLVADGSILRSTFLLMLHNREASAEFIRTCFTRLKDSVEIFVRPGSEMSTDNIRGALMVVNRDMRVKIFASSMAVLFCLCHQPGSLSECITHAARSCARAEQGRGPAAADFVEMKFAHAPLAHQVPADRQRAVVQMFVDYTAQEISALVMELVDALALIQLLCKDDLFFEALVAAHADGVVRCKIKGTRDPRSAGSAEFERTVVLDVERCRRAVNLLLVVLKLIGSAADISRRMQLMHACDLEMRPFVSDDDVLRYSSEFRRRAYVVGSTRIDGIVPRELNQARAHLGTVCAHVLATIHERVGKSQDPESAYVLQCAGIPQIPAQCIALVHLYIDHLVQQWVEFEIALETVAHLREREPEAYLAARYRVHPLKRFVIRQYRNPYKEHSRFVRVLHNVAHSERVIYQYAWLVPPDSDVAAFLGDNPTADDTMELVARCCLPPWLCEKPCPNHLDWVRRYHSASFSSESHRAMHAVPRSGEMYCVKKLPPPLSDRMRTQIFAIRAAPADDEIARGGDVAESSDAGAVPESLEAPLPSTSTVNYDQMVVG